MRKKQYRKVLIPEGEDTPCKSLCDYYWDMGYCCGNCHLLRSRRRKMEKIDGWFEWKAIIGYYWKRKKKVEKERGWLKRVVGNSEGKPRNTKRQKKDSQ